MKSKFVFATVVTVCLCLVALPAIAERSRDDVRGKSAGSSSSGTAWSSDDQDGNVYGARARQVPSTSAKASSLIAAAAQQQGDQQIATLQQILNLGLEPSVENDKLLGQAYEMMAGAYAGTPTKQIGLLGRALQYTSDPGRRARIESQVAQLGGDPVAIQFTGADPATASGRTIGFADSCLDAVAIAAPYDSGITLDIDNSFPGFEDTDWFSFDIPGPLGETYRIETTTDAPGTFSDDTDLTLWFGCGADGMGQTQIAFNDDSGVDFTSLINTACLIPGTYYIEIGGWQDTTSVFGFGLQLEQTGTCVVPVPDAYENDNTGDTASDIGLPTSIPLHANGWGRVHKEIQSHTIFPTLDIDYARFDLSRTELVSMQTAITFPTKWNDFLYEPSGLDNDTIISMWYEQEANYGGRCNENEGGVSFDEFCASDADCTPDPTPPAPGFPDCIPLYFFNVPIFEINPLAVNDDIGGGNFGSRLTICTPPSVQIDYTGAFGDSWLVRVDPWSSTDLFEYQLQVRNETQCIHETEPNGTVLTAEQLTLGQTVHGQQNYSVTVPFFDEDWHQFDVDEETLVTFETAGYDAYACDTHLRTAIGPDDLGNFYLLNATDEDGGPGWLSRLQVILPPANDLLGNVTADADYFLSVTARYINPNFPWTLLSSAASVPNVESEPNGDCNTNANAYELGDTVLGALSPTCDYDTYKFTVSELSAVSLFTGGTADTAIQLVDCSTDTVMACDDDGGPGLLSLINGCLNPGDYCLRVRAYASGTGNYELSSSASAGCSMPGTATGDGLFTCLAYDTCP